MRLGEYPEPQPFRFRSPGTSKAAVALRPTRVPHESTAPLIHGDGAPTIGTCILVQLAPFNIERIEIDSTGGKSFARSQNGLIVIVTKRGSSRR